MKYILMKEIRYTSAAASDLRKYRSVARRLVAKLERYAQTGAGDVTQLVGSPARRLRDGDFRMIFVESETEILVTKIAPRGQVYE
jgi:mRNA interferase RelE/StbE